MIGASPCLSILVLTEDAGSKQTRGREKFDTVRLLAQRMLQLVVSDAQTHRIEWTPANERARMAMRGPAWKTPNHFDRVELMQAIATKLLERDGFVVFHIDGDKTWGRRAESENAAKFDAMVRLPVTRIVREQLGKHHAPGAALDEAVSECVRRLVPLVPFYSIEAWLFQNTQIARERCEEGCGAHLDVIDAWRRDRALLGEISQPKEALCFRDRHNLALAREQFPADDVFKREGQSFEAAVLSLLEVPGLQQCLERTRDFVAP